MESPAATLIQILWERVQQLREEGTLQEALRPADQAVEKAREALGIDLPSMDVLADSLSRRAELRCELGQWEEARQDYQEAIEVMQPQAERQERLARLQVKLAEVYEQLGLPERAAAIWEQALASYGRCQPVPWWETATLANHLGLLKQADGNVDAAEDCFLMALELFHNHAGAAHEQTAAVASHLGGLYQHAGFYDRARDLHMLALESRRGQYGEEHPDTAQSHNQLALALLESGDRSWARRHFEKALTAYEALGKDYWMELEAVGASYCDFLRAEGEGTLADVIARRVREVVGAEG